MAQAPFQLQRLTHQLQQFSIALLDPVLQQRQVRRLLTRSAKFWSTLSGSNLPGWLGGSAIVGLLLLWHWQLIVSLGVGISTCVGVYLAPQNRLRLPLQHWQKQGHRIWQLAWQPANRSLTLAIATGMTTLSLTYFSIALWQELHQSGLAIALIFQSLGLLSVVLLLGWRTLSLRAPSVLDSLHPSPLDRWLTDLTDTDPLKRLIAVQQLIALQSKRFSVDGSDGDTRQAGTLSALQLAECFRLMLNRETEAIVCGALLEGLRVLDTNRIQVDRAFSGDRQLQASSAPVAMVDAIGSDGEMG